MRLITSTLVLALFLPFSGALADDAAEDTTNGGARQKIVEQIRAACGGEVQTVCPGVTGRRQILDCLVANKDQVSDQCRTTLQDLQATRGNLD